jgi:hypothetical protein
MWSRLLADAVVLLHLAFVVFVLFGGLLVRWQPRMAWLHLPAASWGAAVEYGGWICPLTPLEHRLRSEEQTADAVPDFIGEYVLPLLYPTWLTGDMQVAFGTVVVIVNLVVYGWLLRRRFSNANPHRSST